MADSSHFLLLQFIVDPSSEPLIISLILTAIFCKSCCFQHPNKHSPPSCVCCRCHWNLTWNMTLLRKSKWTHHMPGLWSKLRSTQCWCLRVSWCFLQFYTDKHCRRRCVGWCSYCLQECIHLLHTCTKSVCARASSKIIGQMCSQIQILPSCTCKKP